MTAVISRPRDRRHFRLAASVAALVVSAVAVGSAFKGPKPTSIAATATFRCFFDDGTCATNDRVTDDGGGPYNGAINSGTFDLQVVSGRSLKLYLLDFIAGSRTCVPLPSPSTCNPHGLLDQPQPVNVAISASIRVKALTLPDYQDLPGGLTAMGCGVPTPGLVHFTWWMPDNDGHWGFNFNPREYPDTSAVKLTRDNSGTWTVETESGINLNDVGELLSWAHSGIKRHDGPSHEGRFHAPFKFTIAASGPTPSCP